MTNPLRDVTACNPLKNLEQLWGGCPWGQTVPVGLPGCQGSRLGLAKWHLSFFLTITPILGAPFMAGVLKQ